MFDILLASSVASLYKLLDVFEFTLQACAAASQTNHINCNNQPRGREAVKHESKISCVHSVSFELHSMRQPPQRIDFARSGFLPRSNQYQRGCDQQNR